MIKSTIPKKKHRIRHLPIVGKRISCSIAVPRDSWMNHEQLMFLATHLFGGRMWQNGGTVWHSSTQIVNYDISRDDRGVFLFGIG